MAEMIIAPYLGAAIAEFKKIVKNHAEACGGEGNRLVVLCEDRLSLVAERAICDEVGGTFAISVYTLSRFLSAEGGKCDNVLTSQGSAMAISRLIEKNGEKLKLFNKLSSAGAAQKVYDTIALLYSSKISPDDLANMPKTNSLLSRKLCDLELLYREYTEHLKQTGAVDRNAYLRRLPSVIKSSPKIAGADVLLLGFQSFTSSVADAVKACFESAKNVYGVFIGGRESKYVNEASASFVTIAKECGKSVTINATPSPACQCAEHLRKNVFEPESFHFATAIEVDDEVNIIEAVDENEECAVFAATVLKAVRERGVRYRDISVMLPDVAAYQPLLERAFEEYGVPYYVDRRYPLSSHGVCEFLINYLYCLVDGCRQSSVIATVTSPLFAFESESLQKDKDEFINYCLRAMTGRGSVKRPINPDICLNELGYNPKNIDIVRQKFLEGIKLLPSGKADGVRFCDGLLALLQYFNCSATLEKMSADAEEFGFASIGSMSARAYAEVVKVIEEAKKLTCGEKYTAREFIKILRSGFTAAQVSLIPPKQDAVFVGDLSQCANAGSKVLIVGGLSGGVPSSSSDTAILTDSELCSMEKLQLAVSPKIAQVNGRVLEMAALNLCAFSKALYLVYPVRSGGKELGVSEVINYAKLLFKNGGKPIAAKIASDLLASDEYLPYAVSTPAPAIRTVAQYVADPYSNKPEVASAVYEALKENSCGKEKACFGEKRESRVNASLLYSGSISPTTLEEYYSCPYKAFVSRGLRLNERMEGVLRPLDTGNVMHDVLKAVAEKSTEFTSEEDCAEFATKKADELMSSSRYSPPQDDGAANYAATSLINEIATVSKGVYRQIAGSNFKVEAVESVCTSSAGGVTLGGRIDRVDGCGDMVRVIDYKTGKQQANPSEYYMGLKVQLPLYLSAAAEGRRPVGAYYFTANLEYSESPQNFTLQGFMDGSDEVIKNSDLSVKEKEKSLLVGANYHGRAQDKVMKREDFACFLDYAKKLLEKGGEELRSGEITPSPIEGACEYCSYKGMCGFDREVNLQRKVKSVKCTDIVKIVKEDGGEGENESN